MPTRQINVANTVWGQPLVGGGSNEQILVEVVNNSGGTLQHGDVVVWDTTTAGLPTAPADGGKLVTTSTTANDPQVAGVISATGDASTNAQTIAAGGSCWVCIGGVARVNIGAGTVAKGGLLSTTTNAKQAATATTALGNLLGVAMEAQTAKDANNTIRAIIKLG